MRYSLQAPFPAKIKERSLLCKEGSTRNTWHIVIDLAGSGIRYEPGQSIAILPENDPELVEEIVSYFRHYPEKECAELREKLLRSYDIIRPSGKLIAKVSPSFSEREGLDVAWLLSEFSPRISPEEFISCLKPQSPRFYSIASSQNVVGDEVHLVVVEVFHEFKGKKRSGVASSYLCRRCPLGAKTIPVYVKEASHFMLPSSLEAPIIMVGAGTGIAPFRAFLQERLYHKAPKNKNWLFFGERNRKFDFFYKEFFEELEESLGLRLDLSFSRDGETKSYVVHRMKEEEEKFLTWIEEGAYLYVSGSFERLGKSVEQTLLSMYETKCGGDTDAARKRIQQLRREKRYLQDVY